MNLTNEKHELFEWQQEAYDKIVKFIKDPSIGINKVLLNWSRGSGKTYFTKRLFDDGLFEYIGGDKEGGVLHKYGKDNGFTYISRYNLMSNKEKYKNTKGKILLAYRGSNLESIDDSIEEYKKAGFKDIFVIINETINYDYCKDFYIDFVNYCDYINTFCDIDKMVEKNLISEKLLKETKTDVGFYGQKIIPSYYKNYALNLKVDELEDNRIKNIYNRLLNEISEDDIDKDTFNKVKMLRELISMKDEIGV